MKLEGVGIDLANLYKDSFVHKDGIPVSKANRRARGGFEDRYKRQIPYDDEKCELSIGVGHTFSALMDFHGGKGTFSFFHNGEMIFSDVLADNSAHPSRQNWYPFVCLPNGTCVQVID